jgi:hypothetical protein
MWNPTENWQQQGSFVEAVPPPSALPDASPLVCVSFNQEWLPYVLGALQQLCQPTSWLIGAGPVTLADILAEATDLVAIVGNAHLCTPADAGMDPAFQSTFTLLTDANSVVTTLHVTAGRTKGGVARLYADTHLTVPSAGFYTIRVAGDSTVHLTPGSVLPADSIIIATMGLVGHDGSFHSHDYPALVSDPLHWFYFDAFGVGPVDSFSTAPPHLPTPSLLSSVNFNNPSTPVADYTGFWCVDGALTSYGPFAVSAFPPFSLIASIGNPLSVCALDALTDGSDSGTSYFGPLVDVLDRPSRESIALADGVVQYLGIVDGAWVGGSSGYHNDGDARFTPFYFGGVTHFVASAHAECVPHVTIAFNLAP